MKTIWSDKLVPMLTSRTGAFVIEFVLGCVACIGLLAFAALVLYLHHKVGDL